MIHLPNFVKLAVHIFPRMQIKRRCVRRQEGEILFQGGHRAERITGQLVHESPCALPVPALWIVMYLFIIGYVFLIE